MSAALSASRGNPEPVRDGLNRPVGEETHCWPCEAGDWIVYKFAAPAEVSNVTVILDSGLDQNVAMSYHRKDDQLTSPPDVMPKSFRIEGLIGEEWQELFRVERNHQRCCRFALKRRLKGLRFVVEDTWGNKASRVYAFYIE
jgi:hypothetical protein